MLDKEVYFQTTLDIGNLYMDKVLLEFELEPIVFVCTDKNNDLYLCVCYEVRYELDWIIRKIPLNILLQLIDEEMDLYTAMTQDCEEYIECKYIGSIETHHYVSAFDIDRNVLPDQGSKIDFDPEMQIYRERVVSEHAIVDNYEDNIICSVSGSDIFELSEHDGFNDYISDISEVSNYTTLKFAA